MKLFYDPRDDRYHENHGSRILYWLDDLGARPLNEAARGEAGFLFAGARSFDDYRQLVSKFPHMRDRPAERAPLLRLDTVLASLAAAKVAVPIPRTWLLPLDQDLPSDLTYPLFVRTAETSWKRGGKASKVCNAKQLLEEVH